MKNYIVVVGVDKIQNFLYYALKSHQQESQSDDGTLKEVMTASNFISHRFQTDIQEYFPLAQNNRQVLLACSGKYIFTTTETKDAILANLDKLFARYYQEFQGQLLIKYTCFEGIAQTEKEKMQAVQTASKRLKSARCLSEVLSRENNRQLLFTFHSNEGTDKQPEVKKREFRNNYTYFAENINALFQEKKAKENDENQKLNENHFRIAVIKADLDGMGNIFSTIKDYQSYQKVSQLLDKEISLEQVHKRLSEFNKKQNLAQGNEGKNLEELRIYPLYMAGDDIFFAVPISQLLNGVTFCTTILNQLNKGIDSINRNVSETLPYLSLSVGVDITFNREPLRYYYERVDYQLDDCAKKVKLGNPFETKDTPNRPIRHTKISINGTVFFWISEDISGNRKVWNRNKTNLNWHRFVQDIHNLNGAIATFKQENKEEYQAHHFYYSLLEKITNPTIKGNQLSYSNAVLYHLLPQTWTSNHAKLQQAEFHLLEPVIRQLFVEDYSKGAGKNAQKIAFGPAQKSRLEAYVRLLLLFSDPRFSLISEEKSPTTGRTIKRVNRAGKRILVNKSLDYIYGTSLINGAKVETEQRTLRQLFVQSAKYELESEDKVAVYRTLTIGNSMFYRMKKMMSEPNQGAITKIGKMLAAANPDTLKEVQELGAMNQSEHKAPPNLYFNEDVFKEVVNSTHFNSAYVDALLIFYQYKERAIQFQTLIKK